MPLYEQIQIFLFLQRIIFRIRLGYPVGLLVAMWTPSSSHAGLLCSIKHPCLFHVVHDHGQVRGRDGLVICRRVLVPLKPSLSGTELGESLSYEPKMIQGCRIFHAPSFTVKIIIFSNHSEFAKAAIDLRICFHPRRGRFSSVDLRLHQFHVRVNPGQLLPAEHLQPVVNLPVQRSVYLCFGSAPESLRLIACVGNLPSQLLIIALS